MTCYKQIKVSGKVQGVFFRASAKRKAEGLDIKGMVRNEHDGSVYMEVAGEMESLKEFIAWCHLGPIGARVDKVELADMERKNYNSFEIIR